MENKSNINYPPLPGTHKPIAGPSKPSFLSSISSLPSSPRNRIASDSDLIRKSTPQKRPSFEILEGTPNRKKIAANKPTLNDVQEAQKTIDLFKAQQAESVVSQGEGGMDNTPDAHEVESEEASEVLSLLKEAEDELNILKDKGGENLSVLSLFSLFGMMLNTMNVMANKTLSLDKKYLNAKSMIPSKTERLVSKTRIEVLQNQRSDSFRESAKSLKIISVPTGDMENGQVIASRVVAKTKDVTSAAKHLMGNVSIRPLRRSPVEGAETVPTLITFKSSDQCSDAERALRSDGVRVAPNYSPENFQLIKKIRSCLEAKHPGKQILIRPSQSYLNLNIKMRNEGESWTFLTSIQMPLTAAEMHQCGIKKNPCNNIHIQI